MDTRNLGLLLIGIGVLVVVVGALTYLGALSWFGKLPGDLRYQGEHTRVLIPITSMLLVSVVLTLVLNLLRRWL